MFVVNKKTKYKRQITFKKLNLKYNKNINKYYQIKIISLTKV